MAVHECDVCIIGGGIIGIGGWDGGVCWEEILEAVEGPIHLPIERRYGGGL